MLLRNIRSFSTISSKATNIAMSDIRGMLLLPQLQAKIQDRQYTHIIFVFYIFGHKIGYSYIKWETYW